MSDQSNFQGLFSVDQLKKKGTVKVNIGIVTFDEGDTSVVYAPALEVYGYGKGTDEAEKSFITGLSEFIDYTLAKDTLDSELKRLGWVIKGSKRNRKFRVPDFAYLLSNNERLIEILNTKPVKTFKTDIPMALA